MYSGFGHMLWFKNPCYILEEKENNYRKGHLQNANNLVEIQSEK